MNAVLILVGLLVLSYLGSFLFGRSVRGIGLPSGVEYAALGFVLGPHALGMVGADNLAAFEPVVQVALGWLAFVIGLDFGVAGDKRVRPGSFVLGSLSAILAGGASGAAAWFMMAHLDAGGSATDRIVLAGGVGAACSQTTRHAIRWVYDRDEERGPLAQRINEIAHTDDFIPLLGVAVLFALAPTRDVVMRVPLRDWPSVTVGLGLLMGAGAALLLRSEMPMEDTWAVLFGVSLIAIGTATRLAVSTLTVCFFMGLAVSALSSHRAELRAMVGPTERPVLLPALVLAGARIDFRASHALPWIAAAAIAARLLAKIVTGWLLAAGSRPARKAGPLVGLSLMSSGALAMCIGLAFALRFPGVVGDTILAIAAIVATIGEFVGPTRLRRALAAAGEIVDTKTSPSTDTALTPEDRAKAAADEASARGGASV
jgi:Kef-type K+ transport system membrane component KefB